MHLSLMKMPNFSSLPILLLHLSLIISCYALVEDTETQMVFEVQHSFSTSPNVVFKPRGVISVKSIRSSVAYFMNENKLDSEDRLNFQDAVAKNGLYRIRVMAKNAAQSYFVSSFIKACSLYESSLSDILTLSMDQSGFLLGTSLTTMQSQCQGLKPENELDSFNTTIIITTTEPGPMPDTQAYVQKLEREKDAKAKGEQPDNRSFFAKYWMYIVPVLIFLAISGASPEPQQGGR